MHTLESISRDSVVYLRSLLGHIVLVSLRGGEQYRGRLCFVDNDMNIRLQDAESVRGNEIVHIGDIRITGDIIENAQLMDTRAEGDENTDTQHDIDVVGNDELSVVMEESGDPVDESLPSHSHVHSQDSRLLLLNRSIRSDSFTNDQPGTSISFPSCSVQPSTPVSGPSTSFRGPCTSILGTSISLPCLSTFYSGPSTHPHVCCPLGLIPPPTNPSTSTSSSSTLRTDSSGNHSGSVTPKISPSASQDDTIRYEPDPIYIPALDLLQPDIHLSINFDESKGISLIMDKSQAPHSRMLSERGPESNMYDDRIWPRTPHPSPSSSHSGLLHTELGSSTFEFAYSTYEADPNILQPSTDDSQAGSSTHQSCSNTSQPGQGQSSANITQPGSSFEADTGTTQSGSSSNVPDPNTPETGSSTNRPKSRSDKSTNTD